MSLALDNPIWHSLRSHHAPLGAATPLAACYAASVAPFAGVAEASEAAGIELAGLLGEHEPYYLVGIVPPAVPGWQLDDHGTITQMLCKSPPDVPDGPKVTTLGPAHVADMLELTALVFPGYFRQQTLRMGRYLGIYLDGRLAAMAGERMDMPGYREISAVCTHPAHTGRGYAQRLVALITRGVFAEGVSPFLHVSTDNRRAKAVYARLGYAERCEIALYGLHREQRSA